MTFEFMTAAAFEARLCPTWPNEIKKTKLRTYTSPAAGINFLLCIVPFSPKLNNQEKTVLQLLGRQYYIVSRVILILYLILSQIYCS